MKRLASLLAALACLAAAACQRPEEPTGSTTQSAQEPAQTKDTGSPSGAGPGTITPMGGVGAGPMTPVAGSESLQGGGGGTGQVMKDKARSVASQSPSSLGQAGDDGG